MSDRIVDQLKALVVVMLLAALSACQTLPSKPQSGPSATDRSVFKERWGWQQQIKSWKVASKVAVITPDIRESASMVWESGLEGDTIRLFGPLGFGSVRLEFDQQGAVLTDNKGTAYRGDSAEALLAQVVGWPIPLSSMQHWLFALPSQQAAFRYSMEQGQLTELSQRGWLINYERYKPYFDEGRFMPRKIVATKSLIVDEEELEIKVTVFVKSWE